MNPIKPDYFCVSKKRVVDDRFKFINYVNVEDLSNLQSQINLIESEAGYSPDVDDVFELALQKMRQEKDYNIGMSFLDI